jgi:hypothetical protein
MISLMYRRTVNRMGLVHRTPASLLATIAPTHRPPQHAVARRAASSTGEASAGASTSKTREIIMAVDGSVVRCLRLHRATSGKDPAALVNPRHARACARLTADSPPQIQRASSDTVSGLLVEILMRRCGAVKAA